MVNQARTGIAQEPVLKVLPQAPAWPQKQFTTPLQPDLEIGNDQDWYDIQSEPLEPKGKNPQKIHVQPAPPPVLGKKNNLDIPKTDTASNYQIEKDKSKDASWLLVLAFLFLGLLFGAGGGFAGGFWFRSGNEEALLEDQTVLTNKIKEIGNDLEEKIQKYSLKITEKDNVIRGKFDELNTKNAEIINLTQLKAKLEEDLRVKSEDYNRVNRNLEKMKENPAPILPKEDPDLVSIKTKLKDINDMPLLEKDFMDSIMNSDLINNETKKDFQEKSRTFLEKTRTITDPVTLTRIKDQFFVVNASKLAIADPSLLDPTKKKHKGESPIRGGDDHLPNQIKSITTIRVNDELLKKKPSDLNEKEKIKWEELTGPLKANFVALAHECKNLNGKSKLIFIDEEKPIYGTFTTFNLTNYIKLADSFETIKSNYSLIKDQLDKNKELPDVESFVDLCRIFNQQRKKAQGNLAKKKEDK